MSIENFIPQVWSARLMANLHNVLVYGQPGVTNRDWEGDIREAGGSVRINAIGTIQLGDYTKNQDFSSGPQIIDDAGATLVIEKSRYYNFYLDNVDRAQTRPDVMNGAMQEAAYAIRNDMDSYIATKIIESPNTIGTDASPITCGLGGSDTNAYELLVDIAVKLDEANTPPDNRWAIVSPWFYGLLLKDPRFVSFGTAENRAVIRNGVIGTTAGMTIMQSNNVPKVGNNWKVTAGHGMAVTFADQLQQTEAYKPEKRFGDAVKGLALFGAKLIRPRNVVVATVAKGS